MPGVSARGACRRIGVTLPRHASRLHYSRRARPLPGVGAGLPRRPARGVCRPRLARPGLRAGFLRTDTPTDSRSSPPHSGGRLAPHGPYALVLATRTIVGCHKPVKWHANILPCDLRHTLPAGATHPRHGTARARHGRQGKARHSTSTGRTVSPRTTSHQGPRPAPGPADPSPRGVHLWANAPTGAPGVPLRAPRDVHT